ncbi:hypothetical protein F7734_07180 [Scytonema sp. UIC 10036]|uniref:roadblock/LC7 domain-containing protein n=1 Tax=Scytonema sp. UIC 10036 TaxID=2304196 RepID=UPI0012DA79FE|nr:roadblock/LC7 domain-containing protein [Scytonema sp. UIC 10036]MUG92248.1 hypothetical protein [Scytonema sp. UIC 10036]
MPLGKILNLLLVALERISAKPAKVTDELQTTEELPSTTTVENTELSAATVSDLQSFTEDARAPQSEIFEEKNATAISMLQDELHKFVSGSAEVEGVIIITPDGMALASVLSPGMDEELTAAMSASMLSLGEHIGRELARGAIDRVVVEGERGYGVLVNCSQEVILLVLASPSAKQGILFLEIKQAIAKIAPLLK